MIFNSAAPTAPNSNMPTKLAPKKTENPKADEGVITVDVSEIGSTIGKGVRGIAGLTSVALSAPKTVIAPTLAAIASENNLSSAEIALGAGTGALALGRLGWSLGSQIAPLAGGVLGFAGGVVGGIFSAGITLGLQSLRNTFSDTGTDTLFNYDGILKAKSDIKKQLQGTEAQKKGASFVTGYTQAIKESYQSGRQSVDSTLGFVSGASQAVTGFASGASKALAQ